MPCWNKKFMEIDSKYVEDINDIENDSSELNDLRINYFKRKRNSSINEALDLGYKQSLENLKGARITHRTFGKGTILNVVIEDDESDNYNILFKIHFDDENKSDALISLIAFERSLLSFDDPSNNDLLYRFNEEKEKAIQTYHQKEQIRKDEKTINKVITHFNDGYDVWYKYLIGKIKTTPNDFDYEINRNLYITTWENLKAQNTRKRRISNSLDGVEGSIEESYMGNVQELITWLRSVITSITVAPGREEDVENIQAVLDEIEHRGGKVDNVRVVNSTGDMRNYTIHLKINALDTCPDIKSFRNWHIEKFDFKTQIQEIRPVYNEGANQIDSRKIVLDYLLNYNE